MVYIPGLGSSSFPGGLAGVPGSDGAAGTDAPLGGAGYYYFFDDFIQSTTVLSGGWTIVSSAASFNKVDTGVDLTGLASGVISMGTTTSTSGNYTISHDALAMSGGFATFDQEWRVYVPVLSDATNRYILRIGFMDVNVSSGTLPTDGAYFEYLEGTSNNWRYCTASNSSRTETSSSIAVAAGSFIKLRIVFAPALVSFYVNGVLAGTTATNLPSGTGRTFCLGGGIRKTAGATERLLNIDYVKLIVDWTVDR